VLLTDEMYRLLYYCELRNLLVSPVAVFVSIFIVCYTYCDSYITLLTSYDCYVDLTLTSK
jgi:hypothetical protein